MTDAEFFETELGERRQVAYRHIRVAKLATAAEVSKYSPSRLNLAIAYVEGKTGVPVKSRGDVDFALLRIEHVNSEGKKVVKKMSAMTFPELREAVSQVTKKPKKAVKESPASKVVTAAVKRPGVKGVQASISKSLVVLRVPLSGLAALARELSSFEDPTG